MIFIIKGEKLLEVSVEDVPTLYHLRRLENNIILISKSFLCSLIYKIKYEDNYSYLKLLVNYYYESYNIFFYEEIEILNGKIKDNDEFHKEKRINKIFDLVSYLCFNEEKNEITNYLIKFLCIEHKAICKNLIYESRDIIVKYINLYGFKYLIENLGVDENNNLIYNDIVFLIKRRYQEYLLTFLLDYLVLNNINTFDNMCCMMYYSLDSKNIIRLVELYKLPQNKKICSECINREYNFFYFNYIDDNNIKLNNREFENYNDFLKYIDFKKSISDNFPSLNSDTIKKLFYKAMRNDSFDEILCLLENCQIEEYMIAEINLYYKNKNIIKSLIRNKNTYLIDHLIKILDLVDIRLEIQNLYYYYNRISLHSYNILKEYCDKKGIKYNFYPYKGCKFNIYDLELFMEYGISEENANNYLYYGNKKVIKYIYKNFDLGIFNFEARKLKKIMSEEQLNKFKEKINNRKI